MELNKSNIKKILFIIFVSLAFLAVILNISTVWLAVQRACSFFAPFVLGSFMALVANVLLVPVESRLFSFSDKGKSKLLPRLRRPLSLIVSTVIVVFFIVLVLFLIVPEIQKTVEIIIDAFPSWLDSAKAAILPLLDKYDISAQRLRSFNINWSKVTSYFEQFIKSGSSTVFGATVNITTSIFSGIFNFVLGIVFSYYVLLQKEKLAVQGKKLLYAIFSEKRAKDVLEVADVSSRVFSSFIRGQVTEAFIIGFLCCIGMLIFRMPYALMISVLIGVTALIPVFGAFLGTAVGALLIVMVDPMKALWFIVFIIVLQQLEGDLIYPKVVGSSVGLPGIWVLVAATVGASAGGITGLVLSVPLSAAVYTLIARYVARRLDAKGIDSSRWQLNKAPRAQSRIITAVKNLAAKAGKSKSTRSKSK